MWLQTKFQNVLCPRSMKTWVGACLGHNVLISLQIRESKPNLKFKSLSLLSTNPECLASLFQLVLKFSNMISKSIDMLSKTLARAWQYMNSFRYWWSKANNSLSIRDSFFASNAFIGYFFLLFHLVQSNLSYKEYLRS